MVSPIFKEQFLEQVHQYMRLEFSHSLQIDKTTAYYKNGEQRPVLIIDRDWDPLISIDCKEHDLEVKIIGFMGNNEINARRLEVDEDNGYRVYEIR